MWVEGSCHWALQPHPGVARVPGPGFPPACVYSESGPAGVVVGGGGVQVGRLRDAIVKGKSVTLKEVTFY